MASGFQCLGCLDYETDCALTRLPCGQHAICLDCIRRMVQFAVEEEKQYPLRCGAATCPDISTQLVRDLLNSSSDAALLDRFQEKIAEYAVPASQRTYCASRECCSAQGESRYLDAKVFSEGTMIICPDCSSITCSLCKELRSGDAPHTCTTDDHDQMMREYLQSLPDDERWLHQKCFQCGSWIEKSEACNQ